MPDPKSVLESGGIPRTMARVGVWLAGSALIGSAALVLWNRKALRSLRDAADERVEALPTHDDHLIY